MKRLCRGLATTAIFIAALGATAIGRAFVTLHWGSFYVLEVLFLVWLVSALVTDRQSLIKLPREMPSLWAFAAWGSFLILLLYMQQPVSVLHSQFQRIAQHAILFVYPLFWMTAGAWMWITNRAVSRRLLWVIFLTNACLTMLVDFNGTVPLFLGNISVGLLLAILSPLLMDVILRESSSRHRGGYVVLWIVVSSLAFWPVWRMWINGVQRTTALILFVTLVVVPFLIRRSQASPFHRIVVFVAPFTLFIFGIGLMNTIITFRHHAPVEPTSVGVPAQQTVSPPPATVKPFSGRQIEQQFLKVARHGEDIPEDPDTLKFGFRTRGFMWKTAIRDWRHHPVLGVGFLPEVPSSIISGMPNNGNYEYSGSPPVSGPHSSYLTILARMGLVGAGLFIWLAAALLQKGFRLFAEHPRTLPELLLVILPLNGFVHAAFNVGFESPHRCVVLWLVAGMLIMWRPSHENPSRS